MALYLEHFGIREHPFKITPTTEFFYRGGVRGEVLDALLYSIQNSEGILKVSGEVGSGKTMLCRTLMENLPPDIEIVYIANPSLSGREILYNICEELRLPIDGDKAAIVRRMQDYLIGRHAEGKHIVVCIDEAQAMPDESLEELRLLSNLETGRHKLLQIVLFGQPELDDKLARQNMRQLRERVIADFNLQPLSARDVRDYIATRLRAAGYNGPQLFSDRAGQLIWKVSQGLSRRINILADKSLLAAFSKNALKVEREHAKIAVRDAKFAKMKYRSKAQFPPTRLLVAAGGGVILTLAIIAVVLRIYNSPPAAPAAETATAAEAAAAAEAVAAAEAEAETEALQAAEQLAADAAAESSLVAFTVTPDGEIIELSPDEGERLSADGAAAEDESGSAAAENNAAYLTNDDSPETAPAEAFITPDPITQTVMVAQTVVVAQTVFVTVAAEPADAAAGGLGAIAAAGDNPRWRGLPANSMLRGRLNASEAWLSNAAAGEYTARLMTVPQNRAVFVERFLRDFARFYDSRLVSVYPAFIAGEDQFVIAYGVFPEESAAQSFIARLPAHFKGGQPFAQATTDSRAESDW